MTLTSALRRLEPRRQRSAVCTADDLSDHGKSWRELLCEYNEQPDRNPRGLYPAYRLTETRIWSVAEAFGVSNVYILSAGWV